MTIATTSSLTRRYGNLTAVNGINLEVPQGAVFGFLGPNGAGKTTTIRMLLGLIRPDAGSICLFGEPSDHDRKRHLSRIGALVESPSLYEHLTGRENLEVTRRLLGLPHTRVEHVLRLTGLEQAAGRKAGQYSTGMCQRLGLAQALLQQPEMLILDEPTNGLDPAGILEFRDLIRSMPEKLGVTVFLSSHLLHEVEQIATHVGIIKSGRLEFQGSMSLLKQRVCSSVILQVDSPEKALSLLGSNHPSARLLPENRLSITVESNAAVAAINARLVQNGIQVYHLSLESPSLEQIFFDYTTDDGRVA